MGALDSTFIESSYGGEGTAPNGYKRAVGRGAHVLIDRASNVMAACVLPGNRQDADGARILLPSAKEHFPKLRTMLGDNAYRQRPLAEFAAELGIELDGDSPPLPQGAIFKPMPLRWRIERYFAWLVKWRRVAKNWCYSLEGFAKDVWWSIFGLTLRRSV